jgi:hypothetical protein
LKNNTNQAQVRNLILAQTVTKTLEGKNRFFLGLTKRPTEALVQPIEKTIFESKVVVNGWMSYKKMLLKL